MMLLILRVVLAAVSGAAAIAKLRDTGGTRRAVGDFGVAERLVGIVSVLVPVAELAIAALLLPDVTAPTAAAGALLLLVVFVTAIGANLARGRRPECNCFGQLHSAPVGWRTIARRPLLLLFGDSQCGPCIALASDVARGSGVIATS